MPIIKVLGETRTYAEGTPFLKIAEEFQPRYKEDILLVRENGKLKELHKTVHKDAELSFLTFSDPVGRKTYEPCSLK